MDDAQEKIVSELVEVTFPEKDDFLKIRETLSRIGVRLEENRNYSNLVISYTSVVITTSLTSKSYSNSMVNLQT